MTGGRQGIKKGKSGGQEVRGRKRENEQPAGMQALYFSLSVSRPDRYFHFLLSLRTVTLLQRPRLPAHQSVAKRVRLWLRVRRGRGRSVQVCCSRATKWVAEEKNEEREKKQQEIDALVPFSAALEELNTFNKRSG